MLDERKLRVLYAIIDSYVSSAEPIGSRTISKYYDLGVSPATIRNEMSDLEDLGFLNKTHSSSGRVPSDKAYRLYVDKMINMEQKVDKRRKQEIKSILEKEHRELDQLVQNSAKLLSQITSYTALALSPQIKETKIKHIQLVPIEKSQILLIIVNETGLVKNTVLKLEKAIPDDQLLALTNMLNIKLKNKAISEIEKGALSEVFTEFYQYKSEIEKILPVINKSVESIESVDLYADGITKLLSFPEYKDIDKVRTIISFIEDKNELIQLMVDDTLAQDISIKIGNENYYAPIKDCSIITATYKLDGETIGKIGILGPTRMDYISLAKTLKIFSENISEIINNYNVTK